MSKVSAENIRSVWGLSRLEIVAMNQLFAPPVVLKAAKFIDCQWVRLKFINVFTSGVTFGLALFRQGDNTFPVMRRGITLSPLAVGWSCLWQGDVRMACTLHLGVYWRMFRWEPEINLNCPRLVDSFWHDVATHNVADNSSEDEIHASPRWIREYHRNVVTQDNDTTLTQKMKRNASCTRDRRTAVRCQNTQVVLMCNVMLLFWNRFAVWMRPRSHFPASQIGKSSSYIRISAVCSPSFP